MPAKTHVKVGFANPYLVCEECRKPTPYWHSNERCGPACTESWFNYPCGHTAGVISICPSWSSVDGCKCGKNVTHGK